MPVSEAPDIDDRRLLLLGTLAFAVFLAITAVAMLGPLLVETSEALGVTVAAAGQLVTAAAGAWAVTALAVGPFSDAYGRKPVLLLGVCLLATGGFGLGLAADFSAAIGFSALAGMGAGMIPPTCIALIGDAFPARRRPMSIALLTMQSGVSSLVGVPLAAVLADYLGWRAPFLGFGAALIVAAVSLLLLVPGNQKRSAQLDFLPRMRKIAAFSVTWRMAGATFLARMCWGVIITFFPAYLILTFGMSTAAVALPVAAVAIWNAVAPLLGGRIGRGPRRLGVTAAMLLVAAAPALAIFLVDWGLWTTVLFAGLFMLLIVPITTVLMIVIAETGGDSRGALAGVISSASWGGAAAGAAIGGVLVASVGFEALSILLAIGIVGSGLIMAFGVDAKAAARTRAHFSGSGR